MIRGMIDLNLIPEEHYRSLIALPYRIGYFVSASDKTGGSESEGRELQALENLFTFYVEDALKSEFAQQVMLATLQHKAYWPQWRDDIDHVPEECTEIVGYLEDRLDIKSLVAFKNNLLEIGVTVAMAYNEGKPRIAFLDRIKAMFAAPKVSTQNHEYLNVSMAEKAAINQLAGTLGIPYKVS